jgi:hypothetical protein
VRRQTVPPILTYDFGLPDDVRGELGHGLDSIPHIIGTAMKSDIDGLTYGLWLVEGPRPAWVLACPIELPRKRRGAIPRAVREVVRERDGNACRTCGSTADVQLDHIKPWCRGGADTVDNLQCLCGLCNRRKWHTDKNIA